MQLLLASDQSQIILEPWTLQSLTTLERLKNGLRWFGLFFGLAVVSILIPVFHFILVPGFLFFGIYAGFANFRKKEKVITNQCHCLKCQKSLKEGYLVDEDRRLKCQECGAYYLVR